MKLFDNNAVAQTRIGKQPSLVPESEESGVNLYPMLIDHAAVIVGRTLRPEPGMFKFRSKLLRCTFDKGDIWAFVVRGEQKVIICSVSCGPYKEFSIIDEIPFPAIEDYVHTQSKSLRLPRQREVGSRHDVLALVAGCLKRKPTTPEAGLQSDRVHALMSSIRSIYAEAVGAKIPRDKIIDGIEIMFSELLTIAMPGEKSLHSRYMEAKNSGVSQYRIMEDLRCKLLNDPSIAASVSDATEFLSEPPVIKADIRELIRAIVDESFKI